MHWLLAALLGLSVVGGCAYRPTPAAVPTETSADDWGLVADAIEAAAVPAASCHARGPLPDPACTPGATNPAVTPDTMAATICVPVWTAAVRPPVSYTSRVKRERLAAYGMAPEAGATTELDHLIPLALGGNPRDARNLWPEAAEPVPGYHQKDAVERAAQLATCGGTLALADAQAQIAADWTQLLYLVPAQSLGAELLDPAGEP